MIGHDEVDALLAGYVLESLSGEDAAEVERLLTDHVPDCADCRATLDSFQGVVGEIGLSPAPADPPEPLLPRLHRSLDGRRRGLPAWNPARLVAAAAAAIVVVGVAGLAITQRDPASQPQLLSRADIADVQALSDEPDTQQKPIEPYATELFTPGLEELYVFGRGVPPPPQGWTYRLWTVDAQGVETWVGDFMPIGGDVVLRVAIDPTTVGRILITVEPIDSEPSEPGSTWAAAA